jgi:hypothetical protein
MAAHASILFESSLGGVTSTEVACMHEIAPQLHRLEQLEWQRNGRPVAIRAERALVALTTEGVGRPRPSPVLFEEAFWMTDELQIFAVIRVQIEVASGALQSGHVVGMAARGTGAHGGRDRLEGSHALVTDPGPMTRHASSNPHRRAQVVAVVEKDRAVPLGVGLGRFGARVAVLTLPLVLFGMTLLAVRLARE